LGILLEDAQFLCAKVPELLAFLLPHQENPVRNSRRMPSLHRLADMTHFQVSEICLTIGARHGQIAHLTDRIERAIVIPPMRVMVRVHEFRRHMIYPVFNA
jgi:hypothetical protein